MIKEKVFWMSVLSSFFFAINYTQALLGKIPYSAPFPIGMSIVGAALMCVMPVWIIQSGGSRIKATLGAIFVLVISTLHFLMSFNGGKLFFEN